MAFSTSLYGNVSPVITQTNFYTRIVNAHTKKLQEVVDISDIPHIKKELEEILESLIIFEHSTLLSDAVITHVRTLKEVIAQLFDLAHEAQKSILDSINQRTPTKQTQQTLESKASVPGYFNFLDNPFLFKFLSFSDLMNCLRVNKFFNEIASSSVLPEKYIFLNSDKSIFFNVSLFSNYHPTEPLTVKNILNARKNAVSTKSLFQVFESEKSKLQKMPEELRKIKPALK